MKIEDMSYEDLAEHIKFIKDVKIGVTGNLERRIGFHRKENHKFDYVKTWEVKYPYAVESLIKERHYKDDFCNWGSEWYGDLSDEYLKKLENDIDEIIKDYSPKELKEWLPNGARAQRKKGFVYLGIATKASVRIIDGEVV